MSAKDDFDPGPYVCPGCYAVGEERCAPWCIDAAIAARDEFDRETRDMADWDGEYEDDDGSDGLWSSGDA